MKHLEKLVNPDIESITTQPQNFYHKIQNLSNEDSYMIPDLKNHTTSTSFPNLKLKA